MKFYAEKSFWIDESKSICGYIDPCDEFMRSIKASFCCVFKVNFGNVTVNMIAGDSKFATLDDQVKEFIIYHEIGHVNYNHLAKSHRKKLNEVFREEFEADEYAASIVSKYTALYALYDLIKHAGFLSKIELFVRMLHIAIKYHRD